MTEGLRADLVQSPPADFGTFYRQHLGDALRLAYLLCGDERRAEEAVADVFVRIYPRWIRGDVDKFRGYLRRALVNELRNHHRHRLVERREEARRTVTPGGQGTEEQFADRERLLVALAALGPRQRAAIVLRYYADMSERETAAVLGMSVGSVKSSVSRGLARLRELLEER